MIFKDYKNETEGEQEIPKTSPGFSGCSVVKNAPAEQETPV